MRKSEQLERLIEHYAGGNKSKMARLLGVSPQAISTWITRDAYDIELIYAKCENINPEWLLTGKGEMIISPNENYNVKEPDFNSTMAESPAGYINIYEKLYLKEKEENRILIEEIGMLKERIRSITEEQNGLNESAAKGVFTERSHVKSSNVISKIVRSKDL